MIVNDHGQCLGIRSYICTYTGAPVCMCLYMRVKCVTVIHQLWFFFVNSIDILLVVRQPFVALIMCVTSKVATTTTTAIIIHHRKLPFEVKK